jgi:hypothetical protein
LQQLLSLLLAIGGLAVCIWLAVLLVQSIQRNDGGWRNPVGPDASRSTPVTLVMAAKVD